MPCNTIKYRFLRVKFSQAIAVCKIQECNATIDHLSPSLEYKTDPYSDNSPLDAICSRGDLASPPESGGCTDSKVLYTITIPINTHCTSQVTDYLMAKNLTAYIRNGPTHQV